MRKNEKVYLAVDLGASSGRVVAGLYDGNDLRIEEVLRFPNGGISMQDRLYWDLPRLWSDIQEGLRKAARQYGEQIRSVGVDTWGVDFGLLGRDDELLGNPYNYRDKRTGGIFERAFPLVSREDIYAATGLQFMEINTLFQLVSMKLDGSPLLAAAENFLMMPDLFHWLLTGEKVNEYTMVSTSQCYDPQQGDWAWDLIDRFGLPKQIFGQIASPGTQLGGLSKPVAELTGLTDVQVILPGTHDTASAVMATPADSEVSAQPAWCYISSGTWSLMGVEIPGPIINQRSQQLNFTNEVGVAGTIRLLKNIAGLWLVQECRRVWKNAGANYTFELLVKMAAEHEPLVSLIDPDDKSFVAPKDMPTAIREYCQRTGQPVPDDEGAVIRCALESLALRYRMVLGYLEELVDGPIDTIHIVGGGSNNKLLNQMAADSCNRTVVAGPGEATAIGNVMMQAVSCGDVGSIAQAREVIRRSFDCDLHEPHHTQQWDDAYRRFEALVKQ
jgi:rhamnulokinase